MILADVIESLLERIKEEYLRWSQSHRERGLQRSHSETGREWGRRTPGRGSAGGSAGEP